MTKWENKIMLINDLTSYKQIYDMDQLVPVGLKDEEETRKTALQIHNCPRIVGPATNYKFKYMLPMTHFLQKINDNSRPWLRVYKPNTELKRIDELKLKNQELIDKTDM